MDEALGLKQPSNSKKACMYHDNPASKSTRIIYSFHNNNENWVPSASKAESAVSDLLTRSEIMSSV